MIPHKKGIPQEQFSFAADVHGGFYALGMNPSLKKRYLFACLQAIHNLARQPERSNAFIATPHFAPRERHASGVAIGGLL